MNKNKILGGKTPKAKLMEVAHKADLDIHEDPITDNDGFKSWKVTCTLKDYKNKDYAATCIAHTRKEAEHAACKEILGKLKELTEPNESTGGKIVAETNSIKKLENKSNREKWLPPIYQTEPVGKAFKTTCTFNNYKTEATSPQKKSSKHLAADKMCQNFEDLKTPTESIANKSTSEPGTSKQSKDKTGPVVSNESLSQSSSTKTSPTTAQRVKHSIYFYEDQPLGPNVYKGYYEKMSVNAAVKRLPNISNITYKDDSIREIKILQDTRHEHLVKYFITETDSHFIYIAMELADYGTLEDYLKLNVVDDKTKTKLLLDTIKGLEYLHLDAKPKKNIIVHRDIKPSNILVFEPVGSSNPVAKLADFGISKLLNSDTQGGETVARCTIDWAAPETIMAFPGVYNVNTNTDIFSMGLVIFWVMSGAHPFDDGKSYDIRTRIVENPPLWDKLKICKHWASLQDLLESVLDKQNSKRPTAKFIKTHPFFWNSQTNHSFIMAVANDFKNFKELKDPILCSTYQTKQGNWVDRISPAIINFINTKKHQKKYSTTSVFQLLDFIRDMDQHYDELSSYPELLVDGIFGENAVKYKDYFPNQFPELTIFLHNYFIGKVKGLKLNEFYTKLNELE